MKEQIYPYPSSCLADCPSLHKRSTLQAVVINYAYPEEGCKRRTLQPSVGTMGFPSSVCSLLLHRCCRPVSWRRGVWSYTDAVQAVTRLQRLRRQTLKCNPRLLQPFHCLPAGLKRCRAEKESVGTKRAGFSLQSSASALETPPAEWEMSVDWKRHRHARKCQCSEAQQQHNHRKQLFQWTGAKTSHKCWTDRFSNCG